MVTEDPEITKAATEAAAAKTAANATDAAAAEEAKQAGHEEMVAPDETNEPVRMARERSPEEIQAEMEAKSKPVAAIWGNVDPRTQRRAISR